MSHYIISNDVGAYYDVERAKKMLEGFGVTETYGVRRSMGSGYFPKILEEIAFETPSHMNHKDVGKLKEAIFADLASAGSQVNIEHWHPLAEKVYSAARQHAGYLEISCQDGHIRLETRRNGDMERDEPGKKDLLELKRFTDAMRSEFPGLVVEYASIDEWAGVEIPFSEMDILESKQKKAKLGPR